MTENILAKIFEHNNWANAQMVEACLKLTDAQLDAKPASAALGSIRETLAHLAGAQHGYLSLLTLPVNERERLTPAVSEAKELLAKTGEKLLALANDPSSLDKTLETRDGYYVQPWVIMLQAINHATEHREQINSMLTALGVAPLELDGWAYGELVKALVLIKK